MTDQIPDPEQNGAERQSGAPHSGPLARLPLAIALAAVALVWIAGCVWSWEEQSGFAHSKGFQIPWLLPAVIDGLAIALASVAFAASLDGRPAVFARLGTTLAVAGSATSNGAFAWQRTAADLGTVVLAAVVPVAANLAFEVLLGELRRQVLRRRGIPAPVAVPLPRMIRSWLSPWSTFFEWRRLVLDATALAPMFDAAKQAAKAPPSRRRSAPPATPTPQASEVAPTRSVPVPPGPPSAKRAAQRKSTPAPTGPVPLHVVGTEQTPAAVADAGTLRGRFGDALPDRGAHALVQREFRWGGQKATNAIRAYRLGDDLRRSVGADAEQPSDDQERHRVASGAGA